jgi:hypothetical protein|tara:strand:- start:1517 stop:1903 length:387 start_codon:yes stop_codon:yes gene_type:complete
MSDPLINLITAPDKLLNSNPSVLLVNPSDQLKENFNSHAGNINRAINLYLFENNESEIGWLLDIVSSVDYVILDIDNTKIQQWIIGYILNFGKTFYLTNTKDIMYNIVNVNRIYELKQFMEGVKYFEV